MFSSLMEKKKKVFKWISNILQAQFDASEMITQRELVSQKVSEELTERGSQFGLILDDISLVSKVLCLYVKNDWCIELANHAP